MAKFVLNVYHHRLKEHIAMRLADKNNAETYLDNLYSLYSQTVKLTGELSHFNLGESILFDWIGWCTGLHSLGSPMLPLCHFLCYIISHFQSPIALFIMFR